MKTDFLQDARPTPAAGDNAAPGSGAPVDQPSHPRAHSATPGVPSPRQGAGGADAAEGARRRSGASDLLSGLNGASERPPIKLGAQLKNRAMNCFIETEIAASWKRFSKNMVELVTETKEQKKIREELEKAAKEKAIREAEKQFLEKQAEKQRLEKQAENQVMETKRRDNARYYKQPI